jgi:peroxiredoxin (alkyl hydroperoxide reductase subunit C)
MSQMRLVNHTFRFRALGDWINQTTDDLFADKKVVLFSLPGAFTPTCSSQQLPGYEGAFNQFKELGIDEVYCMSVNDAFVMNAWANAQGIEKIKMIADGDGIFTRSMGMLVDKPAQKFGLRSWRYSAYIVDGEVEKMFIEPGINNDGKDEDPFEVSDAETMLTYIKGE